MNQVNLIGRLTRDPEIRSSNGAQSFLLARYTLAVDRFRKDAQQSADFIPCVTFGKSAEFAEKWLSRGMKIAVHGRIQTGSYINKEGRKVYTTEVIVDEQEFADSKPGNQNQQAQPPQHRDYNQQQELPLYSGQQPELENDGFMNIPDNVDDEGLPFN